MRIIRSKRYKCIQGDTPEQFEEAVNAVLEEFPSAELTIDTLVPYLCHAWIRVERQIPETISEEHELAGDVHYCIECPYLDRPKNSRKNQKRFPCPYADYGITMTDSMCCDKFYEFMERQTDGENA